MCLEHLGHDTLTGQLKFWSCWSSLLNFVLCFLWNSAVWGGLVGFNHSELMSSSTPGRLSERHPSYMAAAAITTNTSEFDSALVYSLDRMKWRFLSAHTKMLHHKLFFQKFELLLYLPASSFCQVFCYSPSPPVSVSEEFYMKKCQVRESNAYWLVPWSVPWSINFRNETFVYQQAWESGAQCQKL